ncbi:MAG: hypothetical protein KC482_09720, partial [Dehalococcoidia bacterium]|nr:hypothetical protein [Dehalococcoidia bacterium]
MPPGPYLHYHGGDSMLFNVSTLLQSPVGDYRRYVLAPDPPIHHGTATLTRTPHGVLVQLRAAVV